MVVMVSTQWSWNSARLIALVLNALSGLENYYSKHYQLINMDGIFGLRIIEGCLDDIYRSFQNSEIDPEIITEIHNLSIMANVIVNKGLKFVIKRNGKHFEQFQYLLGHPYKVKFTPQRTDERLRWKEKELKISKIGFQAADQDEKENDSCFAELLSTNYDLMEENYVCKLSDTCLKRMVGQRGLTGYHLTRQILYAAIALQTPCVSLLSHYLQSTNSQTVSNFLTEYCTNLIDELGIHLRNPKNTARLDYAGRDLLMEQIFACGEFGFVEISSLHLLASILSWQNPILGCFMKEKLTTGAANSSYDDQRSDFFASRIFADIIYEDSCSSHSAVVAGGALVVFLRFLLDRGPWPEYYLANQPVIVYSIAAEDKFRQYRYNRWVRDSFILSVRNERPPEIGWSPDLLAYIFLLCIIFAGSFLMHIFNKPKTKQFYYFSYKKL